VGQKVHPNAFRLGVYKPWQARWFADKDYTELLLEDAKMRRLIVQRLRNGAISKVETERSANQVTVIIWTAKPGIVIGKGGASVDQLRDDLEKLSGKKVRVTIQEIKHPELDAMLVAQNVAAQLERRIAFRRAVKQSVLRTMRAGAKGVKIAVSGRLGGAEMSRREWDRDGRVPLHTLKANIDFGQTEARTTFGRIGVSVWVYLGDFETAAPEDNFEEIPARQLLDGERDGGRAAAAQPAPAAAAAVAAPAATPPPPAPASPEPASAEAPPAEAKPRTRRTTAKANAPASETAVARKPRAPRTTRKTANQPADAQPETESAAPPATAPEGEVAPAADAGPGPVEVEAPPVVENAEAPAPETPEPTGEEPA